MSKPYTQLELIARLTKNFYGMRNDALASDDTAKLDALDEMQFIDVVQPVMDCNDTISKESADAIVDAFVEQVLNRRDVKMR